MSEEMTSTEPMESAPVESTVSNEAPETTSTPEPSSQPQSSVWDSFRGLPDFEGKDDADIARSLYQSMEREKAAVHQLQQYQQLIPYAQEYMQYREPFEQWRNSRNQPQQQQPAPQPEPEPQQQSWWNPPEVKPEHKRYLVRDEAGREVIAENAPLDARYALENYMTHRAEFAQKFLDNPQEALGPMVAEMAQKQAQEIIESEMANRDESSAVTSLEEQNADWLYEEDGKTPTEEGLAIQNYIQQAAQLGINGVEPRWEYATAMLERDLLNRARERQAAQAQRQQFESSIPQAAVPAPSPAPEPPQAPPTAQNSAERDIDFLRREASRNPSRSASRSQAGSEPNNLSFEERLKAQLQRDNLI